MSFIRTKKRENPFVQLDKAFIGNGVLSLKSTGLLTYILSKPDGWQIRMKDIQNKFTDGETSVRSAMKELINTGYVNRYRERGEDGKFGDWIYEVYERPDYNPKRENPVLDSPKRDFPDLDNPEQENHAFSNNDFSNNDFSNIKEEEEEEIYYHSLLNLIDKNIIKTNEVIKTSLKDWLNKLPYDVLLEEINNCIKRGAKTWIYIENTFNEDLQKGITTVQQVQDKIKNHKSRKTYKNKRTGKSRNPVRQEKLPEWFNDYQTVPESNTGESEQFNENLEQKKLALQEKLKKYKK